MSATQSEVAGEDTVLVERDDDIVRLTLNRPDKYNALTTPMMQRLTGLLADLDGDETVRVVVLQAGGKAFCAGHDFAEVSATPDPRALFGTCSEMMMTVHRIRQPVIAQVQGIATGAGCQLVAACDMAIAGDEARLATSGINVGLFCSTPSVEVGRNVMPKRAMEMLFTGDFVDAATAADIGLINRAVPMDALPGEVDTLARKIAAKAPTALALGKRMFYNQMGMDVEAAYRYTSEIMTENLCADDCQEGIAAFMEKRKPSWAKE
ncbi:enoyl-CoA hydratase [Ectothiorhodospiraceae bacterium WFHF3C12]|nr:enoyl-CoA hydratase [Ectothiorhodospiraceae bacterium WFHF3C12]